MPTFEAKINKRTMSLNKKYTLIIVAILAASFSRLIPHPPNFTAIGALALFGGAIIPQRWLAYLLPFAAMLLADFFIGFHGLILPVYISFFAIVFIGQHILKTKSMGNIIGASILSSLLFFAVTNFAVWLSSSVFPKSFAGLIACYAAAIPFFENSIFGSFFLNTVLGDLFFNGVLFGSYFAVLKYNQSAELAEIKANN
jgi:hypothetical protein